MFIPAERREAPRGSRSREGGNGTQRAEWRPYFSDVATVLKVPVRLVPTVVMAVMITTAIRAAIRPYSMAVAPLSFERKRLIVRMNRFLQKVTDNAIPLPWVALRRDLSGR